MLNILDTCLGRLGVMMMDKWFLSPTCKCGRAELCLMDESCLVTNADVTKQQSSILILPTNSNSLTVVPTKMYKYPLTRATYSGKRTLRHLNGF